MSFVAWLFGDEPPSDATALVDDRRSLSFRELRAKTRAAAARVRQLLPAAPARRHIVPILAENATEFALAHLGVMAAGHVPALVPPLSRRALASVLDTTEAALVLGDAARLADVEGRCRLVELEELERGSSELALGAADVGVDEPALILFTSGSTGQPRGVVLSQQNLVANTEEILAAAPIGPGDRTLSALPLYYCYGTSVLHTHLRARACLVFDSFRFPQDAVARIGRERITLLPGVPSLFEVLVRRSTLGESGCSPAQIMISGGRTATSTIEALRRRLPRARILLRYGVTELTAAASFLPPERLESKLGSIGRGLPRHALSVVRSDGTEVEPGEDGEVFARGPHVSLGYFRDRAATEDVFRRGGFHTGDVARVDDEGFITIVGRNRDFIKSAGHRISPHEIEDVLSAHAAVVEAAVVGMPDALRGEAPVAVVVLAPSARGELAEVEAHAGRALPSFKLPTRFVAVEALPRTESGKIRRGELAQLVSQRLGRAGA